MPTFTSIGLHPDLHHRIVAKSSNTTTSIGTNNATTSITKSKQNHHHHHHNNTKNHNNNHNTTNGTITNITNHHHRTIHHNNKTTATVRIDHHNDHDTNIHQYHTITTPISLLNRNPKQSLYLTCNKSTIIKTNNNDNNNSISNTNHSGTSNSSCHHHHRHHHHHSKPATSTTTTATNNVVVVRPISYHHIQQLRYDVAVACIQSLRMEHYYNIYNIRRRTNSCQNNNDSSRNKNMNTTNTTNATFIGMVSAYDLLQNEMIRNSSRQYNNSLYLSTGCIQLDTILQKQISFSSLSSRLPVHLQNLTMTNNSNIDNSYIGGSGIGGIPFGYVTQISGPSSSGKTQFVLSMIAKNTVTQNTTNTLSHVYYIGHTHSNIVLASKRLYQILQLQQSQQQSSIQNTSTKTSPIVDILQRTTFTIATNIYQILYRLHEFESYILDIAKQQQQQQQHNKEKQQQRENENDDTVQSKWQPILFVIDSCSSCFGNTTTNHESLFTLQRMVGHIIRRITKQYHIVTILINGIVSNFSYDQNHKTISYQQSISTLNHSKSNVNDDYHHNRPIKPALGYKWNNTIPDIHLWFEPCNTTTSTKQYQQNDNDESTTIYNHHTKRQRTTTIIQVTIDRYPQSLSSQHHNGDEISSKENNEPNIIFVIDHDGIHDIETNSS